LKRCILTLLLFAVFSHPDPSSAQTFSSVPASIKTLPPIPAIPCGGPFAAFCIPANQYIATYNSYVSAINKINEIGLEVRSYARYPQQISSTFQTNMNGIASVLQQANTLSANSQNIERQVSQLWPNYAPGTPLSSLNGTLENNTATSIIAELKGAKLLNQSTTDASMTASIAGIRSAAANAQNPTQAAQVEVQLLTLIWEQLVKEQNLLALRMSEEAQHDLSQAANDRQQRQYDQAIVTRLQNAADGTPPSFTPAQINAMFNTGR
jgi:P-type conjugative transfer protein TrbJ